MKIIQYEIMHEIPSCTIIKLKKKASHCELPQLSACPRTISVRTILILPYCHTFCSQNWYWDFPIKHFYGYSLPPFLLHVPSIIVPWLDSPNRKYTRVQIFNPFLLHIIVLLPFVATCFPQHSKFKHIKYGSEFVPAHFTKSYRGAEL